MKLAIVTRVLPATDTKGARVRATSKHKMVTIGWDHGVDAAGNHELASLELLRLLDDITPGLWVRSAVVSAELPNGDHVHIVKDCLETRAEREHG